MTKAAKAKIRLIEDGPIAVINLDRITLADGSERTTRARITLCRCGASAVKPYCDGSHKAAGFSCRAETPDGSSAAQVYESEHIAVHYNRLLCSHAGECTSRLAEVFDASRRPWIMPEHGDVGDIRQVVAACPSGALRIAEAGNEPQHLEDDVCSVTVQRNGPYLVRNVDLIGGRLAEGASRRKYALCRCGKSSNKPFCDGTHYDAKWKDD